MIVGNLVAKLRLDAKGFVSSVSGANTHVDSLGKSMKKGGLTALKYAGIMAGVGTAVAITTMKLAKLIAETESIDRRMAASIGSAEGVERAWSFLRGTSERLGIGLEDLATSYGSLAAAGLSAGMKTEDLENIFTAVSEKAAVLGMSSHRVRLTFLAIEQMASKAVISMEELRRQFGENIPGAMGIMARALDVSVPTVNKWVASGKLMANEVLPLLAHQMSKESAPAIKLLGDSMQKSVSKMSTAWLDFKRAFSGTEGGDGGGIKSLVKDTVDAMADVVNVTTKMTSAVDGWLASLKNLRKKHSEWREKYSTNSKTIAKVTEDTTKKIIKTDKELAAQRKKIHDAMNASTKESIDAWRDTVNKSMESVASEFTNLVTGLATGADVSVGKMLESMAVKLIDFTTTMLVVRPVLEWFKTWLTDVTQPGAAAGAGGWAFLFKALGAGVSVSAPTPDTAMADGGIINEPVIGVGLKSNSSYLLGESGPEAVVPTGAMGGGSNISVNINAVDSKSVTDLMKRNPQAIIGPLVKAMNGGDRGLATSMRMVVG